MNDLQKAIIAKQKILLMAKEQLKKEFVGLDNIIDQIINLTSSWFLLPDLQDKPIIINLWGLTGVGKSSLINRLAELLSYTNKFYHFNLGNKKGWGIQSQLEEIYENSNGYPIILAFDEFQYAKTFENGKDVKEPEEKIIWEILDSGKFMITRYNREIETVYGLLTKLYYALCQGVKVENGIVIYKKNTYDKIVIIEDLYTQDKREIKSKKNEEILFYPEYHYDILLELNIEKFSPHLNVRQKMLKLNGKETLTFLKEILEHALSPKTVDCSKSIIFILGNLDEAYTMSNNYNADMDADEFHKQSLKINIPDIKNVLQLKFRNEHIARLGNNHIIYPAFSSDSFKKIIDLELAKIASKIEKSHQIKLIFSNSVRQIIYKEGVYPTQGTRPVYTTIHQLITSKLGDIITQIYLNNLNIDSVFFSVDGEKMVYKYFSNKKLLYTFSNMLVLNLSKLRKNKHDDLQAITAVHESGHAVLLVCLMQTLPEVVYSITAGSDITGFVYSKFKWKYISRKELVPRIAIILGGYAAEEMIFGKDYLTAGAASDIDKATTLLSLMYKDSGMGSLPISYALPGSGSEESYHNYKPIEEEIKNTIEQALDLARITLLKEKTLLIKMADYLSDNRMLKKDEIEVLVNKYATTSVSFIKNGDLLYYRNHLKKLVSKTKQGMLIETTEGICLNKEKMVK